MLKTVGDQLCLQFAVSWWVKIRGSKSRSQNLHFDLYFFLTNCSHVKVPVERMVPVFLTLRGTLTNVFVNRDLLALGAKVLKRKENIC